MHAKSVEKITLTAEERETHELKSSYFDEAKTQLKCEWVDRKRDGKGEGRVIWYFESGGVKSDGYAEDGVAAGTWRYFREDGTLLTMIERRPDGSEFHTSWPLGQKEAGAQRKDGAGRLQRDGWWVTYENDQPVRESLYRLGTWVGNRAPLATLRPLLEEGRVEEACALIPHDIVGFFFGVDGLLDEEGFALKPEVALEIAMRVVKPLHARWLSIILPHAATLLPTLEAKVDSLIANAFEMPESQIASLAIYLPALHHAVHPETPLDPRFDEFLVRALSANCMITDNHNLPIVQLLMQNLRPLPLERREGIVLQLPSRKTWSHNRVLWSYATLAPTPKVLELALNEIASLKKGDLKYAPRRADTEQLLQAFGKEAVPAFTAWLQDAGKKVPQRAVVIEALAKTADSRGAATLLAFADDSLDDAKKAAREGLKALGDEGRSALEVAAAGKKGKLKTLAEELLLAMPKKNDAPAPASEGKLPASLVAYRALLASVENERENYRALLAGKSPREVEATLIELIKQDAKKAFAGFAEFALESARTMDGPMPLEMFVNHLVWHIDAHAGLPTLLAQLLYTLPERGSPRHLIHSKLTHETVAALDTLGFLFEQKLPGAAENFARHLAEHHPWEGRRALLALAQDSGKPVRTEAVGGLVRCGARIVPEVLPLLLRGEEGVLSAAEILRALPDAAAIAPLEAAIAKEKNKKRREALEEALAASKTAGGGAVDLAALDADLSRRAEKRKSVPVVPMPPLHWKNANGSQGAALSEGAAKWFLGALSDEDGGEPNAELMLVRKHLVDADAVGLLDAIRSAIRFDHKLKWRATYVFGILGDDKTLALFGAQFQDWASSGAHVLATHGIETLRRNGSGRAIAWLDHWAEEGTGKLQKEAKAALDRTCQERSLDRDGLVDLTTPREAEDVTKAIGEIQRRLEAAMIVGRTFAEPHFQTFVMEHPLVHQAATGLVFQDAERACAILTSTGFVDAAGKAIKPSFPVTIPHPCMLTDDVIATFQDALAQQDIAQPFAQLARPFTRDPESALTALRDQKMATRRMIASIEKLGYKRGGVEDAGIVYSAYRTLAAGWILEASHDGFAVANNRNPNGKESVLCGVSARQRDRYDLRPTAAMQSEALEDLKKLLAD